MTVSSMTGHGHAEVQQDNNRIVVEIKSVNHRFKDFRFKMSSSFMREEIQLRKKMAANIKRGSLEILVFHKKSSDDKCFDYLDIIKIEKFVKKIEKLREKSGMNISFDACSFLRSEFTKDSNEDEYQQLQTMLNRAFDLALDKLVLSRIEEGEQLKLVLLKHLEDYATHFHFVQENVAEYEKHVREKLLKRFSEFHQELKIDESRFLQEVVYYMEKLDVQEELSRIQIHLNKIHKLLNGGEVGRQIDFIVQELGRETNTIGAKSQMSEISTAVVNMKVHLEKIREQALNIE